jgi:phosphohistidine phosphatase
MRLYLAQHGEAVQEEVDPARPLTTNGRADVARIANFLAEGGVRVGRVLHSGKPRAEQTAAILAALLAPGSAPEARARLNPNDPTEGIAQEVGAWDQDVMLVGHLPFMARLASRLVAGREDAPVVGFQPGSVLCLERGGRGRWTIVWMIGPELVVGNDRPSVARSD